MGSKRKSKNHKAKPRNSKNHSKPKTSPSTPIATVKDASISVYQALIALLLMGLYVGGFMSLATICHTVVNFLCYKVWTGLVVPYLCTWGLDLSVIQVATPSKSSLVIGSFLAAALTFVAIVALIAEGYHLWKGYTKPTMISEVSGEADQSTTPADINPPSTKHEHEPAEIQHKHADTNMTANGSNTKNELIKSHHEEAEEGQNAPIPAKATQTRIKTPSTKTEKKKAGSTTKTQAPTTTSSTTDRQAAPVVNDSSKKAKAKTSVEREDAFVLLVKTMLNIAMGAGSAAQQEISSTMAGLFKAAPAWMLTFGAAHNPGCSARAGLEAFQRLFQSKASKDDYLATLGNSATLKSMALLFRTFVAVSVQQDLDKFNRRPSGRLMAKDILRMTPEAGMPKCLSKVPEWQLSILHQKLSLIQPACD